MSRDNRGSAEQVPTPITPITPTTEQAPVEVPVVADPVIVEVPPEAPPTLLAPPAPVATVAPAPTAPAAPAPPMTTRAPQPPAPQAPPRPGPPVFGPASGAARPPTPTPPGPPVFGPSSAAPKPPAGPMRPGAPPAAGQKPPLSASAALVFGLLDEAASQFKGNQQEGALNVMLLLTEALAFATTLASGGHEPTLKTLIQNLGTQISTASTAKLIAAVASAKAAR